jgi:hypothetical protein
MQHEGGPGRDYSAQCPQVDSILMRAGRHFAFWHTREGDCDSKLRIKECNGVESKYIDLENSCQSPSRTWRRARSKKGCRTESFSEDNNLALFHLPSLTIKYNPSCKFPRVTLSR